ncbi:MAG: hypothetical protein D6818_05100 [Bacteroidetes bacterium]|nr:MAG: hypothetical protein D6818_05100 [Bacteroidota bacterium]
MPTEQSHPAQSDVHFTTDWLNLRFPFDEAARNGEVEAACLRRLGNRSPLTILDLGAGLGANCVHLGPRIRGDQRWLLLDHDGHLPGPALAWMGERLAKAGYSAAVEGDAATFADAGHRLQVQYRVAPLDRLMDVVDLGGVDLVTANALLDLLNWRQVEAVAGMLADFRLPLLATINYAGMSFEPSGTADLPIVGLYEQHMTREQEGGARLGKQAVSVLEDLLEHRGYRTLRKPSVWKVGPGARALQKALLDFMERALRELELMPGMVEQWEAWLALRRAQMEKGELHIEVRHFDLWAEPA